MSEDIPYSKSAGTLRSNKLPTTPSHNQLLGRTHIIRTQHEVENNAPRHMKTPQKKQKPPLQAKTEIVDKSLPRFVKMF